ncbi:MAG: carboxypeptidase regulatory-like domain-containing protein [Thermoanaerobaculales bacterium]|nr:carboxypeptidase regulatory-like domain-containing protein [Thermoanaerobaculales bacterium]
MKRFLGLICVMASAAVGLAQGVTTGSLAGVVTDPTGAPLRGAAVEVELLTTGTRYETTTDSSGRFNLVNARVGGPYQVQISVPGMQARQVGNVFVALGEITQISVELQLEAIEAELVVIGRSSPLIGPSRVGAASNVGLEALEALPTIGRGFEDFARTNPLIMVQPDREDGPSVISVAGRNNRYNNIQIDGAVNNDLFGLAASGTPGGQSETTTISLDSIQELQLVIAPFDVRQGGFSGGGVNAITRSGTNSLRGSLYSYYRNDSMIGDGPSGFPKFGAYEDLNYGFRIGGPVVQDKIFFFVNGDISRREKPTGWSIDGSTGQTFANGTLTAQAERFRSIMASYGHDIGDFEEFSRNTDSDKLFVRMDFNLNNSHNLTIRHNWVDAENVRLYPGNQTYTFPGYAYNFTNETNSTVFQLDSMFADNMFNQARITYQTIKDRRSPASVFPRVSVTDLDEDSHGFVTGAERYSTYNSLDQTIIEITDDFSFFLGDHELVVGTHNEIFKFKNLFIENGFGSYEFFSLDDLEAGIANRYYYTYSADDDPYDQFNAYQLGFYVGDKWRVNANFNVIIGLRLDIPKFPDAPNRNPETEELFGYRTDEVPDGNELWSPRLGFNWDITGQGKSQLRGGVGVFSGRSPYVWISNNYARNGIEQVSISAYGDIQFNPDPYNQPTEIPGAQTSTQEVNLVDPNFEFPQVTRYNLAYDHKLPWWGIVASIEAVHAKSQSEILYKNLNLVQTGVVFDGRPYYERVSDDYSGAYFLTNTSGGEQTNLSVKIEKPYGDGFWGYVSYAWGDSKVVNEGNSSRAVSNWRYMEAADPNNMTLSRSDYEVEHRYNASLSYRFNRDSAWSTTVSAFYNHQSGRPFSVLSYSSGYSLNGDDYRYNDLFYVPASADEVIIQGGTWEQLDAFITSAGLDRYRGQIAPRNASQGPWRHELDLKVAQDIPVGFGDLEVTLDIANLMNLLDSDAGHVRYVPFGNVQAVRYAGDQPDTGLPIYQLRYAVSNPEEYPMFELDQVRSRWRAKVGLRWSF